MEEKKTSAFAIPVFSFVPTKYKELIKNSAGKLFLAVFLLFIVLGVINAIGVSTSFNNAIKQAESICPDFSIVNGNFSCEKTVNFAEDGVYFMMDDSVISVTEDDIKSLITQGYYNSIILLGKKNIGVYGNGQLQVFKYADLNIGNIDKHMLFNQIIPTFTPIIGAVVFVYRLLCMIGYYLATLIMGVFVMIISSIMNKELIFKECFRITLLAKMPVYIVLFAIEKFITIPLMTHLLIGAILILIYASVVLYMFDNEKPVATIEENN